MNEIELAQAIETAVNNYSFDPKKVASQVPKMHRTLQQSFLQKLVNYDGFVGNDKIHIASAGIDPKVLINNTTYPIRVVWSDDDPKERATIVDFDKRSIVLPIRGKGIGAIVSAEKSA